MFPTGLVRVRPLNGGEYVRLAEARYGSCTVATVGPHRIHRLCAGRERVVIADEGTAREEPVVGIPVLAADLGAGEAYCVVARHRLPRVDPHVRGVEPAVEPDHVEAPGLIRRCPREELVVGGGLAGGVGREELRVRPMEPAIS